MVKMQDSSDAPDLRLDRIRLTASEQTDLCIEVGSKMTGINGTTVDHILEMAKTNPNAPAIRGPMSKVDGTIKEMCYADFVRGAMKIANEIKRVLGISTSPSEKSPSGGKDMNSLKDRFIAIYLRRDIEYVMSAFAIHLCGAAYVPLSDKLPDERLAYILHDSRAELVITTDEISMMAQLEVAQTLNPENERVGCLYLEEIEGLLKETVHDPKHRRPLKKEELEVQGLPGSDDLAYMIYTSGTTGNPKGVTVEHHGLLNVLMNHMKSGLITMEDIQKSVVVAAFIFDSHVRETWLPLVFGGCLCIAEDVLHMAEGTKCAGTPSGLQAAAVAASIPATLKTIMAGGERLTGAICKAITYPNTEVTKVINAYGPTETVIESLVWEADLSDGCSKIPDSGVPIGLPVANAVAYGVKLDAAGERDEAILEKLLSGTATTDCIAKRGEICELYMGGEAVARGYHNRADLTSQKFMADPFEGKGRMYQTGDLVIFPTKPGEPLQYVGRVDTQVKVRGKRLELGEVESYLQKYAAVSDVKVLLKTREGEGHLAAYVVWEPEALQQQGAAELEKELLQFARLNMEDYKRPEFVVSFPLDIGGTNYTGFPLAIGGKVDTKILPDPWDVQNAGQVKIKQMRSVKESTRGMGWSTTSWNSVAAMEAMEAMIRRESESGQPTKDALLKKSALGRRSRRFASTVGGQHLLSEVKASLRTSQQVGSLDAMKKIGRNLSETSQAIRTLSAVSSRASRVLSGVFISKTNDEPLLDTIGEKAGDPVSNTVAVLLEVVRDMLRPSLGDEAAASVSADDDFFALGLTSLNVPRLKYEVKQQVGGDLGTEQIFLNPTVNRLALLLSKPPEETGADLAVEELLDTSCVQDKPLPKLAVWILTLVCAYLCHAVSIAFMSFLALVQFVYLHEAGKCAHHGGPLGKVDGNLQTRCKDPDIWAAFFSVIAGFPIVYVVTITASLLMVAIVKKIVIGKYKPGVYSIDGPYYFRWLYAHYMEAFARQWLLGRLPFQSTMLLNWYCRLMGANIGKNVHLDTLDIHEMCCLTIEDNVTIQNDAMLSGHTFATVRDLEATSRSILTDDSATKPVLVIGRCWIKKGSTVGPYSMVQPRLPRPGHLLNKEIKAEAATIVDGVLPAMQTTSRLGQTLRMPEPMMKLEKKDGKVLRPSNEPTVWCPAVPGYMQVIGFFVMILFQWVTAIPTIALVYAYLVPPEPGILVWFLRLEIIHTPWLMGFPYALLLILFKWTFIGKFKDGEQCTPYLDNMRWLLHCLMQNATHRVFELASCSSEILNQFYRFMGMKIGWNAQVMPLRCVEFDLFEVGDCVAFGGQVMVLARDANGKMRKICLGNDSAITNSAVVMSGAQVGDHCLVGNLTLLPPEFNVPDVSKCVGTRYLNGSHQNPVVFSNKVEKRQPRWQSNLAITMHFLASVLWDVVEMPGMLLLSWVLVEIQFLAPHMQYESHLIFSSLGIGGAYLIENMIIALLGTCTTVVCVIIKNLGWSYLGDYNRDSPIFVNFIYLTKLQMNQQMWNQVLNGTPWQSLVYRMWGATIAYSARLFMRFFADIDGLRIGANTVLDYDCYIEQHQKTATKIEFHPLSVAANCCIGQRSILLHSVKLGKGATVYPLSSVPPNEPVDPDEVVGGILGVSYFKREPEVTLMSASHEVRTRSPVTSLREQTDIVVVGAGAGGLVAAYEFIKQGLSVKVLEKTDKILGCWENGANETSHVAVSEATYRFPGMEDDSSTGDYPSRAQVLERGQKFFKKFALARITEFEAEVLDIKDVPGKSKKIAAARGQKGVFKHKHGHCEVTYKQGGIQHVLECKGVFVATGAQVEQNHHTFPHESRFKGQVAYGSGNDITDIVRTVRGKKVVIVGGGAFAIENVRTMLMNGAEHVTVVHRSPLQVWPRCVHYLVSTEKDRKFSEYAEVYNEAAEWAGLKIGEGPDCDLAPFMHPATKAQPTASDVFFSFVKMGLVTLIRGEVDNVGEYSLTVRRDTGRHVDVDCDVFLKCIGWKDPGHTLKKIFPHFEQRNFIFMNQSPRVAFVCDPHYSHGLGNKTANAVKEEYEALLETVPIGGTFSVLILARICAWLQMYMIGNDVEYFKKALDTMPASNHITCSWGEQQFSFPSSKECSDMIRYKIGLHKDLVADKHPTVWDFFKMSSQYLQRDLSAQATHSGSSRIEGLEDEFRKTMMASPILTELKAESEDLADFEGNDANESNA